MLSAQGSAENQYSISFFLFYVSCLVSSCCCWGGNSFEGDRASFSQLCRLSFAFLFMSWLVVAGGGQVAVVTGHEAKLLWPSHALDDGEKVTWNNVPSFAPLVHCISLLFLRKKSLSTCCWWASFSTVLFALYSSSCGCLLFLRWTGCSLRFSLPPLLSCLLLLLLVWKGFRRGWGQLLSAVSSFLFIPLLYLFVVAGVDRLPSLGTTLDDGAKVTWNNLTSIAPLVYRYSFLFLGWNGFSLNKLWPIINYHLLLSRLHLMSCDSLLAVAGTVSQLVPLHCSTLLVVVCCFWGGQGALLGTTVWGNASYK